jgi:hypothetical protein
MKIGSEKHTAHRFGLYGLPLERTIFAAEVPELGRGSSTPVTYASVLAGDSATPPSAKTDCQLKDLLNLPPDIGTHKIYLIPFYYNKNSLSSFSYPRPTKWGQHKVFTML